MVCITVSRAICTVCTKNANGLYREIYESYTTKTNVIAAARESLKIHQWPGMENFICVDVWFFFSDLRCDWVNPVTTQIQPSHSSGVGEFEDPPMTKNGELHLCWRPPAEQVMPEVIQGWPRKPPQLRKKWCPKWSRDGLICFFFLDFEICLGPVFVK